MTNATTMAKFERNMETKLEEMMSEVLQTTLAAGETKETLSEMVSRTALSWLLHVRSACHRREVLRFALLMAVMAVLV